MAMDTPSRPTGGCVPLSAREALGEGVTIERWMFRELGLKGTSAIVYAAVWRAGADGLTASLPMMGHLAGVSAKTAKRTLKSLVDAGLVLEPVEPANPCGALTWRASRLPVPLETNREKGLGA